MFQNRLWFKHIALVWQISLPYLRCKWPCKGPFNEIHCFYNMVCYVTDFLPVCWQCFLMKRANKRHSLIFFYFSTTPINFAIHNRSLFTNKTKHFSSNILNLFKRAISWLHIWDTWCIHLCQRGVSGQASVLGTELPVSSVCGAGWARKMVWGWESINSVSH